MILKMIAFVSALVAVFGFNLCVLAGSSSGKSGEPKKAIVQPRVTIHYCISGRKTKVVDTDSLFEQLNVKKAPTKNSEALQVMRGLDWSKIDMKTIHASIEKLKIKLAEEN